MSDELLRECKKLLLLSGFVLKDSTRKRNELVESIDAYLESGGWLPIESAPKDGTPILAACDARCAVIWWGDINAADSEYGTVKHKENWCWLFSDGKNCPQHYRGWKYITHWQPLPAVPKTRGEG